MDLYFLQESLILDNFRTDWAILAFCFRIIYPKEFTIFSGAFHILMLLFRLYFIQLIIKNPDFKHIYLLLILKYL